MSRGTSRQSIQSDPSYLRYNRAIRHGWECRRQSNRARSDDSSILHQDRAKASFQVTSAKGFGYILSMNCLMADITWRPTFSDPNPLAWCIAAIHFVACWLCFSAGRSQTTASDAYNDVRPLRFWFVLAALMFALSVNKQLDLQTLLTQVGREIAKRGGWYSQRQPIQAAFVFGCVVVGMSCIGASFYVVRGRWRQYGLAYLGVCFLLTFIVIRAASFHRVDALLYHLPLIGNWMNAGLELGGALLVGLGAFLATRQTSEPQSHRP